MATTRTGSFEIGFRRLRGWQEDLPATIAFAKDNGFNCLETRPNADEIRRIRDAGLEPAAVDCPEFGGRLISADSAERKTAIDETSKVLRECLAAGAKNFFLVMLPKDPTLPRTENFDTMVDSFTKLAPVLEESDGRFIIEGWPGRGSLVCTPETYRALFERIASPAMGINYDPSHLIRMSIDPIRFAHDFADRIYHVHGKDTEVDTNALYQFGHEIEPAFTKPPGWGAASWRYTIPGHGQMRWTRAFEILRDADYKGKVCIELEDASFNGSEAGEKLGFVKGREYLEGC